MEQYPIRINKYLRDQGLGSRREVEELVTRGLVSVNGKLAKLSTLVDEKDKVVLRGKQNKQYIYLAYYKPRGLSTQTSGSAVSVIAQFRTQGLFPIGRLDKESEGLMIVTNDGRLTTKLIGNDSKIEKEYIVHVREMLRSGIPAIFAKGMVTKTLGVLLPAKSELLDRHTLRVVLAEGKRHQIRIMLSELGYTVESLTRIRIGHIRVGKLKHGETRPLTPREFDQ